MATRIPFEEYVAPDTVSTDVDCLAITWEISVFALLKYGSSSSCDTMSIAVIFPPLMVTATVMVLL